jgi:hypothetical protein
VLNPPEVIASTKLYFRKRKTKVKGKAQSKSRLSVNLLMLFIPTSTEEGSALIIQLKPKIALSITTIRTSFTKALLAEVVIIQLQISPLSSLTPLINLN